MDPAYSLSKSQLLDWLNTLLQTSLTKVEQCASGAVYCQIIDSAFPGRVPLKKVNCDVTSKASPQPHALSSLVSLPLLINIR
ncbi:Microtubule-associated protein RP/EB member 1 [Perkinsus olseni]|uniref:Microtubule-associated protein RP/EB member 1 n=1 Tax=Perkinsus olseni TaxID=32597 RepID=A0A7J6TST1_PEROL|nr:Microtubule-associated protein RP/EB member 1 [Perkinsus olseni]KAF4748253.1 Microtubule-associated protein RP/EB member 1 [Perkinsus olseni]